MQRRAIASLATAIGLLLAAPTAPADARVDARADAAPATAPVAGTPAAAAAANAAPGRLVLPEPSGPYRIGTVSLHLVDRSRTDPWLATRRSRELMVQLWYPAAPAVGRPRAPWLSPGAVPHLEQALGIPPGVLTWPTTHARVGAPLDRDGHGRPVVLYSPGAGGDRSFGTVLVEDLASAVRTPSAGRCRLACGARWT